MGSGTRVIQEGPSKGASSAGLRGEPESYLPYIHLRRAKGGGWGEDDPSTGRSVNHENVTFPSLT